jgi:hypothetical protein
MQISRRAAAVGALSSPGWRHSAPLAPRSRPPAAPPTHDTVQVRFGCGW